MIPLYTMEGDKQYIGMIFQDHIMECLRIYIDLNGGCMMANGDGMAQKGQCILTRREK